MSVRTNAPPILSVAQLSLSVHRTDNAPNFAFVQLNAPFRISLEAQYTSIRIGRYIYLRVGVLSVLIRRVIFALDHHSLAVYALLYLWY